MHATKTQCARVLPLKKRADFLRIQSGGKKWVAKGLVIQVAKTPEEIKLSANKALRCGFTVTKRTDKSAVKRNRMKRRLRSVAADVLALHGISGHDYILVGRPETLSKPYAVLCSDLKWCLRKLELYQERAENA